MKGNKASFALARRDENYGVSIQAISERALIAVYQGLKAKVFIFIPCD